MTPRSVRAAAFGIGVVAGLRSLLAPAIVAWTAQNRIVRRDLPLLALMGGPASKKIIKLAAGELLADKLPFTPDRITPGPLAARIASGAACGAAVSFLGKASVRDGALLGGAGALAGAFGGFYTRRALGRNRSDFPVALVEDLVAIAAGMGIMKRVAESTRPL
ncbi:MAG: DUF4126 domain-containing protein [Acidobacteria bacterium]|nr:DUF4126 domain-containing protein [Acidobacteriota bacterium]